MVQQERVWRIEKKGPLGRWEWAATIAGTLEDATMEAAQLIATDETVYWTRFGELGTPANVYLPQWEEDAVALKRELAGEPWS